MKHLAAFLVLAIVLTSCAYFQHPKTLGEVQADLDCLPYGKGMGWKQIFEKFGGPDFAPLPEPGSDLSRNTRAYKDTWMILYIERQEVKEGEKIRFQEVVTGIEICKKK